MCVITKEQYIEHRNKNEIPINLAYEYYCMKVTEEQMSFDVFNQYFSHFFGTGCFNFIEFYNYYDRKFELTFILDESGKALKCYG